MKFPWYIWIPRIVMILLMAFMALFSIDVFEGEASIWQKLLGLLIHNLPVLVLLLVLLLTWRRPFWAGMLIFIFAVIFTALIAIYKTEFLVVDLLAFVLPMLIITVLFLLSHKNRVDKSKIKDKDITQ